MHNIKYGVWIQDIYTSEKNITQAFWLIVKGNNSFSDWINQSLFTVLFSMATI